MSIIDPSWVTTIGTASSTSRRTTLGRQPVQVTLVEHVLAALAGLRIDNCVVELDAVGHEMALAHPFHHHDSVRCRSQTHPETDFCGCAGFQVFGTQIRHQRNHERRQTNDEKGIEGLKPADRNFPCEGTKMKHPIRVFFRPEGQRRPVLFKGHPEEDDNQAHDPKRDDTLPFKFRRIRFVFVFRRQWNIQDCCNR